MKISEATISAWECDGCGRVIWTEPENGLPYGWSGTVEVVNLNGANGGRWFACREQCIKKAVLAAQYGENERD